MPMTKDDTMNYDLFKACMKAKLRKWHEEIGGILDFLDKRFCDYCGKEILENRNDKE